MKGYMIEAQHRDGYWIPAYNPYNPLIPTVYTTRTAAETALSHLLKRLPACIQNRFRITQMEDGK